MALSRVKNWTQGEELTYSDLNNEFNNILDNGPALVTPFTGSVDLDGNSLILDADGDTSIDSATDDTIDVTIAGADDFRLTANTLTALSGSSISVVSGNITIDSGNLTVTDGTTTLADPGAHTDTVVAPLIVQSTTSGTPAAGIGTGILFKSESADENPSNVGQIEAAFTDIGAGTEDSYIQLLIRRAGGALNAAYRFIATDTKLAIFSHANTVDRTYDLPNAGGTIIVGGAGSAAVTTIDLKTATGSATVADGPSGAGASNTTSSNTAMNAYSFFPSLTYDAVQSIATYQGGGNWQAYGDISDPSDQVGRVKLVASSVGDGVASVGTTTTTLRWRYVTASDMPEMWVAYDPGTGKIVATWASDDPVGGPGCTVDGCTSLRITAKDLESFSVLSAKASDAQALIRDRKLKAQHQAYRALQLLTNDDAPSRWLLNNCTVSNGKLIHVA